MEAAMRDPTVPATPQWRELSGKNPKASLYNARAGIMAMKILCRHDLFRDVTIIGYAGDQNVHEIKPLIGELTTAALLRLRHIFSERFGFDPEDKFILDAVMTLAFENCFDPILDILTEAQAGWDGEKRLDTWVVKYLGCKDTPLNRAIGRKVLIAAAQRARVPGCKFDNITTLEGPEGKKKSMAICTLAGDEFFSDQSILGARDKEIQEQLAGIWMHESADLTGLKKAEVEHVKAFASRQVDRARPAYGRVVEHKKRRSIDWATTNDEEYLQSQTGNRRFWPLPVGQIDIEALRRDRLQLLGEAAQYESEGESVVLDEALWPDAMAEQEKRRVKDPWEDILAHIPDSVDIQIDRYRSSTEKIVHHEYDGCDSTLEKVSSAALLTYLLKIPEGQQHRGHSMRLATCMKKNEWERPPSLGKITIDGQQVRGYYRRLYQHDAHVKAWRDHLKHNPCKNEIPF
jgi:predicted P-loop ATPase